ncbi:DNA cytosine methyltransferase [Tianweitania sediminis]|uniref:DNA (cytosine-5-)-methyltransferase n=1 Tax=Tianweitania sediminis TaxID=1502156 RepID=A0A8J7RIX5_9HYPH|nr:DNA cytosine methyltransferase [Tianweitania sediminis]MBP0438051.1 DNA cytosine methyltransferase [Tianweitania sediminis]
MYLEVADAFSKAPPPTQSGRGLAAVELYSGAGGMSLGLAEAGFEILRAYDHSAAAVAAYNRNIGYHAVAADLTNMATMISQLVALRPDLVAGGPPCQDFSSAGPRAEGDRANHTRIFACYVSCIGPEWFIMENVSRARNSDAWKDARAMLSRAGYGMSEMVLDASFYGVPQKRKRFIVIGRRGERDNFMDASIRNAAAPEPMPLRALFGSSIGDHFYSHPRAADRRGVWSVDGPGPTVRNARRPQPRSYEPHPNDSNFAEAQAIYMRPFFDGRGVWSLDESAPAIVRTSREKPRQSYLDKPHHGDPSPASTAYVLTQSDVSLIQGFPVSWDWSGSLSRDVDQMIANAVPPPLARILGSEILKRHFGESSPEVPGNFGQWLAKTGKRPQVVANVKWRAKQAWQLLGGRDLRCRGAEALALEEAMSREGLPCAKKSDFRRALRDFRDWQENVSSKRGRHPAR